jgi:hypothetical protein
LLLNLFKQIHLFNSKQKKRVLPEIENKSPEMKKTAFRRRLQSPRVNKKIATIKRADAAVKQAILGADRSNTIKIKIIIK